MPDVLAAVGLVLFGVAVYLASNLIGLLVYAGVVCLCLSVALAWRRSQGQDG